MIRIALVAALALSTAAFAQDAAPPAAAPAPATPALPAGPPPQRAGTVRVTLTTSEGPILLELDKDKAPITVANFLHYVDTKRYDGKTFYRVVPVPGLTDQGLVQGGMKFDPRQMFPPIAHEPTTKTGLSHVSGTISMGRNAPGSATSEFFIIVGDMNYMNANPSEPGDNQGYAAFGHVVSGMDAVKKILASPVSATEGPPGMKGQFLLKPAKIVTARRAG